MRRLIVVIPIALILVLTGAACTQSQGEGELGYYQRRVDNMRDPNTRRKAQAELDAAREALRQNDAVEFKRRGDNIMFIARTEDVQPRP